MRNARLGRAVVIRCSPPPDKAPTQPLPAFDVASAATAWIAEMRERSVRS